MIVTQVFGLADFMAYQVLLARISEEYGGVRTAYYYDMLQRQAMAKALERGEKVLSSYLIKLDRDVLSDAKRKVESKAQEPGIAMCNKTEFCTRVRPAPKLL